MACQPWGHRRCQPGCWLSWGISQQSTCRTDCVVASLSLEYVFWTQHIVLHSWGCCVRSILDWRNRFSWLFWSDNDVVRPINNQLGWQCLSALSLWRWLLQHKRWAQLLSAQLLPLVCPGPKPSWRRCFCSAVIPPLTCSSFAWIFEGRKRYRKGKG